MLARPMLSILAVVGLTVLAYPLRDANAQSPAGRKTGRCLLREEGRSPSTAQPKGEGVAPPRRQPSALRPTLLKPERLPSSCASQRQGGDLIGAIWNGRSVSDAALTTRLNIARSLIGDTGSEQRLIKTLPRKGFRFVGPVLEAQEPAVGTVTDSPAEPSKATLAIPDKPSIAVLPFQNMSGDPEQEYFADGMAEDILTGLSRHRLLFVIARNSSFTYKDVPRQPIANVLHFYLDRGFEFGGCFARLFHGGISRPVRSWVRKSQNQMTMVHAGQTLTTS